MSTLYTEYAKLKVELVSSLAGAEATSSTKTVKIYDSETSAQRTVTDGTILPVEFEKKGSKYEFMLMTVVSTTGSDSVVNFVRGLNPNGSYAVTGSTTYALQWEGGSIGGVKTSTINVNRIKAIIDGNLSTGATLFKVGDGSSDRQYFYFDDGSATPSFFVKDKSDGAIYMSFDGVNELNMTTAGIATATQPLQVTAGNIALNLGNSVYNNSNVLDVKNKTAVAGYLTGGSLAGIDVADFALISDGEFTISIDGDSQNITGLDFSGVTTWNDITAVIETGLQTVATGGFTDATCSINPFGSGNLIITSGRTGSSTSVSVTSSVGGAGTDISGASYMNCATGVGTPTAGIDGGLATDANGEYIDRASNIAWTGLHSFAEHSIQSPQICPTGSLLIWTTNTAPTGWLLCYGQAVSRTTYLRLFNVISTTFGVGDGSTTFNLPDLRGRLPLGQDDMGGSAANRVTNAQADTIGGVEGAEKHTLDTTEIPAHTHTTTLFNNGGGSTTSWADNGLNTNEAIATSSTGGGLAHNNMPPYITLNYIIKI